MHITKLAGTNVAGQTFDHKLEPVTLIIGPNYSGKTSRRNAVVLSLLGYLPELGNKPGLTFQVAGNKTGTATDLGVRVELSDGTNIVRTWTKGRKGGVSVETLPEQPPQLITPSMLDMSSFFGMSARDRRRYILASANMEKHGFDPMGVVTQIKGLCLENHTPEHDAMIDELVKIVEAVAEDDPTMPTNEWGEQVQEKLADVLRTEKTKLSLHTGGIQSSALVAGEQQGLRAKEQVDADLFSMDEKRRAADQEITRLTMLLDRVERDKEQEQWLKQALAKSGAAQDHDALREQQEKLDREMESFNQERDRLVMEESKETGNLSRTDTAVGFIMTRLEEVNRQTKKDLAASVCPCCGDESDGWKKRYTVKVAKQVVALERDKAKELALKQEAMERLTALRKLIVQAREKSAESVKRSGELQQRRSALAVDAAEYARAVKLGEIKVEAVDVTATKQRVEALQGDVVALTAKMAALRQELTAIATQAEQTRARAKTLAAKKTAEQRVEVAAAAAKLFDQSYIDAATSVLKEVMAYANQFTTGILRTPLELHEGEIGRFEGPQWIPHTLFSGTEKALAYAGLSVALAQNSKLKLVMIDEMGRMEPRHKQATQQRMKTLTTSGMLGQFIGIDVSAEDYLTTTHIVTLQPLA